MPEELQNLLERIQREGVDKAEAEAAKIVADARAEAEAIAAQAREEADKMRQEAERNAQAFQERATMSLKQAARDVVLSVEEAVHTTMKGVVGAEVEGALSKEGFQEILLAAVKSYSGSEAGKSGIEVILSPEQKKEIAGHFLSKLADAVKKNVEIRDDRGIVAGFRVSVGDDKVEHDFSAEAITEAICQLVRPRLAEIMRES